MKVLLIKDVYNLGRAGNIKKVADGYARNFLIPQKMAVMATQGSLKQIEKIQAAAAKQRNLLNEEMASLAEQLQALELRFIAKVGETGKLYGSITQQMIIEAVNEQLKVNIDRHQVESQPLREVGEHLVKVRLTFDLIPVVKVIVDSDDTEKKVGKQQKSRLRKEKETPAVNTETGTNPTNQAMPAEANAEQQPTAESDQPAAE